MLDSLYIHKIAVVRFSTHAINSMGEPVYSSSAYLSGSSTGGSLYGIPCRIEEYQETTQYRDSNLRMVNKTLIYVAPEYLVDLADEIYDITNGGFVYVGRVAGINNALKAGTVDLDHYEIIIENP